MRGVWHKVKVPGHVAEVLKAATRSDRRDRLRRCRRARRRSSRRADPARQGRRLSRSAGATCWRPAAMAVGRAVPPPRPAAAATPAAASAARHAEAPRRSARRPGRIALVHAPGAHRAQCDRPRPGTSWRDSPTDGFAARVLRRLGRRRRGRGRAFRAARRPAGRCSAPPTAICRRMTGCGRPRRRPRDDLLARLAVVPLVLEARGLDVTPEMAARLERDRRHSDRSDPVAHLSRRDRPRRHRIALVRAPLPSPRPRPGGGLP